MIRAKLPELKRRLLLCNKSHERIEVFHENHLILPNHAIIESIKKENCEKQQWILAY